MSLRHDLLLRLLHAAARVGIVAVRWEGKVVFITGASSGIGAALARAFGRAGARVGLLARREELLREVASEIAAEQSVAAVEVVDIRDRDRVRSAMQSLQEQLGPPDLLIANAGSNRVVKVTSFDTERASETIETNLLGALHAIGAVIPGMVERGRGQIVGISSVAGFRGMPGMAAYSASKAGLSTLLESLRGDLAPHGVSVTTVHPGFVRTPFTASNRFPTPFLVELDRAVVTILRGIERRRRRVDFPWPVVWAIRLARLVPDALWDALTGLVRRRVRIEKGEGGRRG